MGERAYSKSRKGSNALGPFLAHLGHKQPDHVPNGLHASALLLPLLSPSPSPSLTQCALRPLLPFTPPLGCLPRPSCHQGAPLCSVPLAPSRGSAVQCHEATGPHHHQGSHCQLAPEETGGEEGRGYRVWVGMSYHAKQRRPQP